MATHTLKLVNALVRARAAEWLARAPDGMLVKFTEPSRTLDQNAKMWAMLADVSKAEPGGRTETPDMWKAIFMKACDHEVRFVLGLDNEPFPVGFRSSHLSVKQMSDLIEFINWYCAEHDVPMKETERRGFA